MRWRAGGAVLTSQTCNQSWSVYRTALKPSLDQFRSESRIQIMFGEVMTFLHRNMPTLVRATPVLVLVAVALEFARLTHTAH
ncbi:hypothetical protein BH10PSE1_BH10PSE1_23040 [soil metagenome]